ncbi:MAG: Ig-like domain-containing protein, partial [Gemmatimonadota bacterium]
ATNQAAGTVSWLGNPTNLGTLVVEQNLFFAPHVTIEGVGLLTNGGTITRRSVSPAVVHWNIDVKNNGSWDVRGDVAFDKPNGAYHNYGAMIAQSAALLTVSAGATFTNHEPGTVTPQTPGANGGTLRLDGGHFAGTGFVGMDVSPENGGTVDPGAPFGVLTAASYYNPDNSGAINIEVGGAVPGQNYDQFATTGQFTRSGTLNIISIGSVGVCGQVLDIVTDNSPGGQGAFQAITGQSAGAGRAWRVLVKSHVVRLVGFNPTVKIGVEPGGIAVAEGGPSAGYNVCLSSAPTSNVTVTATPDNQVTVAPGSVVFTPANFDLPQAMSVTAVDDAAVEGLHTGTVTHSAASADPSYTGVAVPSLTAQITDNDAAPNQGPVATDDAAATPEDSPVSIAVLGNDSDPDSDPLTVTAVTQPANGTATINSAGTAVSYSPPANFTGSASFTYTIGDGHGHTATATVVVTVTPVNDAPTAGNDAGATTSPAAVTVSVLANDADIDGDALSVSAVTQPISGSAAIANGGQAVTYTPPTGFGGIVTFTYTVTDGHGGSANATVTITVTAPASSNRNPSALDDVFTSSTASGLPVLVLANDSDPDGDPLSVVAVTQPARGTASVTSQGLMVSYTPHAGFVGVDQFTYSVSDGRGGTASATVRVTVIAAVPYDLELDVDVVAPIRLGGLGRQNVTVRNSSLKTLGKSADAPASLVTFAPVAGLALVSVSNGGVTLTCQPAPNGDVTCRVPMLRGVVPPISYTFVVSYRAVQVGAWTPSYVLSPGGGDSNASNNAGARVIVVRP